MGHLEKKSVLFNVESVLKAVARASMALVCCSSSVVPSRGTIHRESQCPGRHS